MSLLRNLVCLILHLLQVWLNLVSNQDEVILELRGNLHVYSVFGIHILAADQVVSKNAITQGAVNEDGMQHHYCHNCRVSKVG